MTGTEKLVYIGEKPKLQPKVEAAPATIGKVSRLLIQETDKQLKLIIEGERLANYQTFTLRDPERLVL